MNTPLSQRFKTWLARQLGAPEKESTAAYKEPATDQNHLQTDAQTIQHLVPYDENLLERSRIQWQFGDWASLTQLARDTLQHHPDRAKLALLTAAGHLQQGNSTEARQFTRLAQDWGCSKKLISQVFISGVHNSLGRTAAVSNQQHRAMQHFERAIAIGTPGSDIKLLSQARVKSQLEMLQINNTSKLLYLKRNRTQIKPSENLERHRHKFSFESEIRYPLQIIVAGMRHSGSTALFNIVRLALKFEGIECESGYSEIKFKNNFHNTNKLRLIKTHEFRDDIAYTGGIIITTRRDLRNTIASAKRRKFHLYEKIGGEIEYAKYNRTLHDIWLPLSDYIFVYESFIKEPVATIKDLLYFLGLDEKNAKKISDELLNLPTDQYEVTLLTPTHITDPKRDKTFSNSLDEYILNKINNDHKIWLLQHGYSL